MKGMRNIAPTGVRIPDELKEKIVQRAHRNGRSINSEIVTILQAAIDEDENPKSAEAFVEREAELFKEALLDALQSRYGKGKGKGKK